MFAVTVDLEGFLSVFEMHFYTKQVPPFLVEIVNSRSSSMSEEAKDEILADASQAGFFDVDDFFQSLDDRPMKTVKI